MHTHQVCTPSGRQEFYGNIMCQLTNANSTIIHWNQQMTLWTIQSQADPRGTCRLEVYAKGWEKAEHQNRGHVRRDLHAKMFSMPIANITSLCLREKKALKYHHSHCYRLMWDRITKNLIYYLSEMPKFNFRQTPKSNNKFSWCICQSSCSTHYDHWQDARAHSSTLIFFLLCFHGNQRPLDWERNTLYFSKAPYIWPVTLYLMQFPQNRNWIWNRLISVNNHFFRHE